MLNKDDFQRLGRLLNNLHLLTGIKFSLMDEWGNELLLEGEGELAKCFCHELDHLDGISLPDRALEWIEL